MFFPRLINSLYWLGSDCTFFIFLWVAKWSKLWGSVEMANVKRIVGVECLLNVSWLGFNAWSGRLRCVWILVWYYAVYIVFFFFFFLTSSLWSDAWHVHLNSTCSHYWYSWDGHFVLECVWCDSGNSSLLLFRRTRWRFKGHIGVLSGLFFLFFLDVEWDELWVGVMFT